MSKLKKVFKASIVVLIIFGIAMFIYLNTGHYQPTTNAELISGVEHDNYLEFDNDKQTGFIFYPGAKVDAHAYSYLSSLESNVYIAKFPFEIGFFGTNIASDIIADNPQITTWYIGGHSLGGVVASIYYQENTDLISGIVYLASYPSDIQVDENYIAIFAQNDLIVGDYHDKLSLFPSENIEVLQNANHSGFGDYGLQKNDSELSDQQMEEQRIQVIEIIDQFITDFN